MNAIEVINAQKLIKYCLIGYPIGHSMSSFIHNSLFKLRGLNNCSYDTVEIAPQNFTTSLANIFDEYSGFNITIPYKKDIIAHLDCLKDNAKIYQSVNTVCVKTDEKIGYNTDSGGFLKSLLNINVALKGIVIIVGCGGVARTFAFESAQAGCTIINVCRTQSLHKSKKIECDIKSFVAKCDFTSVTSEQLEQLVDGGLTADFIINATPVGMYPNINEMPVSEKVIMASNFVYDSIYNPFDTLLISTARNADINVLGGMDMLVWQAENAQRIWLGGEIEGALINQLVLDTRDEMNKKFS